jgi:hypothetical protein
MCLDSKIHLSEPFYNQKKGRKKSAPNPTFTVRLSPDGAIIVLFISNLGSFLFINSLMYFESRIGIDSINLEIIALSVDPLISTTSRYILQVILGTTLPCG